MGGGGGGGGGDTLSFLLVSGEGRVQGYTISFPCTYNIMCMYVAIYMLSDIKQHSDAWLIKIHALAVIIADD